MKHGVRRFQCALEKKKSNYRLVVRLVVNGKLTDDLGNIEPHDTISPPESWTEKCAYTLKKDLFKRQFH